MRLSKITLKNFRCFEQLELDLHPDFTVLIAPNGSGKTTVLDAMRVALWPYVKGFDLGQSGKSATIQIDDVRLARQTDGNMEAQLPSQITAQGCWNDDEGEHTWVQSRERIKAGTNTLADAITKKLTRFAEPLEQQVRTGTHEITLPLISYLGTSRLWFEGRFTSVAEDLALRNSEYSRTSGYLNCLTHTSSFKTFSAWYGWVFRSYREEQILALEQNQPLSEAGRRFAAMISVVQEAVDLLIHEATGWHSLEYKASQNQQLVVQHAKFGSMPVEALSDGLRNAIAMVADLAFRAYKLNPHLGSEAARQTPGVALIDEVDMFLHPAWQQTIVASLRRAFPKVQFIVTTHSPQVLTSVDKSCIRVLRHTIDPDTDAPLSMVEHITTQTKGVSSADLLARIMGVDPVPKVPEAQQLSKYHALIQQNRHETNEGQDLRAQLNQHFGADHPLMLECERMIRLQAFKQRLPRREG